ncbi:MAG: metal-dependent hydrolase [Sphingomonadaceae bacterium]
MDNLTHSMVGAVLGQAGLKRKSGLGMPTLIIAANIPDIDASCTFLGTQSLAIRRGLTHGPIALVLLPLILTGIMIAYDRWQARRGTRPAGRMPIRPAWLLVLAYIGTLSHPALDWLNSYGIRLFEPFSSRWFYGDTLFIIDVWLWALLIGGFILSRRREKQARPDWHRPALISFIGACGYIFANGLITRHAEREATAQLRTRFYRTPTLVVANPTPVSFWRRTMLWRDDRSYGQGDYTLGQGVSLAARSSPTGMNDPRVAQAQRTDPHAAAFLFWSRMPVAEVKGRELVITDQRFAGSLAARSFTVRTRLP